MTFADRQRPRQLGGLDPSTRELYRWANALLAPHHIQDTGAGQSSQTLVAWHAVTTDPTLVDGTLNVYTRDFGDLCFLHLVLTIGASTTLGSGLYSFDLPYPADPNVQQSIPGHIYRAGAGSHNAAVAGLVLDTAIAHVARGDGTVLGSTTGWSPADVLVLQGGYRPL